MKDKLNVCMAMDSYLPFVDGVVNCMDNYLKETVKKEKAFALAPKYKNNFDFNLPYQVLRCKSVNFPVLKTRYGFPFFDRKFKREVYKKDIDIIHLHSPFNMANFCIRVAKRKNIPIVATFHSNFRPILRKIIKIPFIAEWCVKYIGSVYNKMDEVFCVSEGVAKQARSFGYTGKITILPFGTNLKKVENKEELIKKANDKFLLKDESVFLFVGRVMPLKRVDFIIDALKIVSEKGYNFKFFVVGTGSEIDKLKQKTIKLGLEEKIVFTGFLEDEFMPLIYARADLFLFPSLYDNFGLVKMESATYQTPSVFVKDSLAGEGIIDGVNGFISLDNVESFADKIIFASTDKEKLKEIGKKASDDLYMNWESCTNLLISKYKEIIDNKGKKKKKRVKFSKQYKKELKEYIKNENKKYK